MLFLLQSAAVAGTAFINATDTASLSATEADVTDFSSDVYDSFSIRLTDTATLSVAVDRAETASLSLVEVAVVTALTPTDYAVTDTTSLTITETSVVDVAIDVTDTTSLTLSSETGGTPDVLSDSISGTDTASISITDLASVDKRDFNQVDFVDDDTASLRFEEVATVTKINPVSRAKFRLGTWSIKFRIRQ